MRSPEDVQRIKMDRLTELVHLTLKSQPARDLLEELQDTYMKRTSYVRGDTHETAYRLGQESVVKLLTELSEADNG